MVSVWRAQRNPANFIRRSSKRVSYNYINRILGRLFAMNVECSVGVTDENDRVSEGKRSFLEFHGKSERTINWNGCC